MTQSTIAARPEVRQDNTKPPSRPLPHWAVQAGFGPYLAELRDGGTPRYRPSFRGLEIWQIRWIKSQARKSKRVTHPAVTLAGIIADRKGGVR